MATGGGVRQQPSASLGLRASTSKPSGKGRGWGSCLGSRTRPPPVDERSDVRTICAAAAMCVRPFVNIPLISGLT